MVAGAAAVGAGAGAGGGGAGGGAGAGGGEGGAGGGGDVFDKRVLINVTRLVSAAVDGAPLGNHPGDKLGANRWFLQSAPIQMPSLVGGICGRLT